MKPTKIKTTIRTMFILLILIGCSSEPPRKVRSEEEIEAARIIEVQSELNSYKNQEKVRLLAFIKRIEIDTMKNILQEYFVKTYTSPIYAIPDSLVELAINQIANNYQMTPKRVSSLIFSYKYEMQTLDDLIERDWESENVPYEEEQGVHTLPY